MCVTRLRVCALTALVALGCVGSTVGAGEAVPGGEKDLQKTASPGRHDGPEGRPAGPSYVTAAREDLAGTDLQGVKQQVEDAAQAGHNAWLLTSTLLVLFMTAPGLALFYSGLVRKKNVLGVMMQCMFLMGLMTIVWVLWGYSLAFGGSGRWLGNADYVFLRNVVRVWDPQAGQPLTPMEGPIPRMTHMLFRGMFFIFTPALICGAFAERMKFSALVALMVLWGTFVYCPLCHWVWDGGLLAFVKTGDSGNGLAGGALDFAGGTVVHISSGVSALVIALVIGKRLGYGREPMPPHN